MREIIVKIVYGYNTPRDELKDLKDRVSRGTKRLEEAISTAKEVTSTNLAP